MKKCDICGIERMLEYVDGRTKHGPWANMCMECWRENGCGRLGTGCGQYYQWVGSSNPDDTTAHYVKKQG